MRAGVNWPEGQEGAARPLQEIRPVRRKALNGIKPGPRSLRDEFAGIQQIRRVQRLFQLPHDRPAIAML